MCAGARKIGLDPRDTRQTKAEVTAANEYYEAQGCFKAPNEHSPFERLQQALTPKQ